MISERNVPGAADKLLFTPGPLTTSRTVRQAMLRDLGSRDGEFIAVVREVRRALLEIGQGGSAYEAVLVQGRMAEVHGKRDLRDRVQTYAEDTLPDVAAVASALATDTGITHVAMVHSETTSADHEERITRARPRLRSAGAH